MLVRSFDKADYEDVAVWWKKQNWPIVPSELLGKNGFIAEQDNVKLAAIWVFRLQDSPMSIIEFAVGNPDAPWELRSKALNAVVDQASECAKADGAKFLLASSHHPRMIEKLLSFGFAKMETNMTQVMRSL